MRNELRIIESTKEEGNKLSKTNNDILVTKQKVEQLALTMQSTASKERNLAV